MENGGNRLSFIVLCAALVAVGVTFGVPHTYSLLEQTAIAASALAIVGAAGWLSGGRAILASADNTQRLAIAGALLIVPWALFAFLAGFGPPFTATRIGNELRYDILFLNTCAIFGGFALLASALREAGEPVWSRLGFALIGLATLSYLTWAPIAIAYFASASPEPWLRSLALSSDRLLFVGGVFYYAATAAFTVSLARTGWIGRAVATGFLSASGIALLLLALRGITFPDPHKVFQQYYLVPGYVVGIPAVPWIAPLIIGLILLRRAGRQVSA